MSDAQHHAPVDRTRPKGIKNTKSKPGAKACIDAAKNHGLESPHDFASLRP